MSSLTSGNIKLLAIARATDKAVVCTYNHKSSISTIDAESVNSFMEMIRKVLCAPTWKEQVDPNSRHSLDCSPNKFHFTMDSSERVFIVMTVDDYPARLAFKVTEAMKSDIIPKYGGKILTCKENGLDKECSKMLQKIATLYDDRTKADKISSVLNQVDSVKVVMHDSIQTVLSSTEKMEVVEQKTNDLNEQAKVFRNTGRTLQRKMWWKNLKLTLLIVFLFVLVIIIVLAMAGAFDSSGSSQTNNSQ